MTPEEKFDELWSGLTARIDWNKYPNFIFLFKDDGYYFELDLRNARLWCSWKNVWSIFSNEYGMEGTQIRKLIKDQVEQHFNRRVVTSKAYDHRGEGEVEQHFNRRVVTSVRPADLIHSQ